MVELSNDGTNPTLGDPNQRQLNRITELKTRFDELKKRELELKAALVSARGSGNAWPVVEDGTPARPDPQEQKMREELYAELEAAHLHKAKNIRQDAIAGARQFAAGLGDTRQQMWNKFDDIKDQLLVPTHGWSQSM